MNFFEQELRKLAEVCNELSNPVFAGRACYNDLGDNIYVKLQFVKLDRFDFYDALKATIINRNEGEVDTLLLHFEDIWGIKQASGSNFKNGVVPHIWACGKLPYGYTIQWNAYHPTNDDFGRLAASVGAYIGVFTDNM